VVRELAAVLKGLRTLVTVRVKAVPAAHPLVPPQREVHVTVATIVVSAVVPTEAHVLLPTVVVQVSPGVG
jgi:hypothetical protein